MRARTAGAIGSASITPLTASSRLLHADGPGEISRELLK
jgi:hypothetical protein